MQSSQNRAVLIGFETSITYNGKNNEILNRLMTMSYRSTPKKSLQSKKLQRHAPPSAQHEDEFIRNNALTQDATSPNNILAMQQTLGNQYVLRKISEQNANQTVVQRGFFANQVFGGSGDRNTVPDISYMDGFSEVQTDEAVTIDSTDNVKLKGHWYEADPNFTANGDAVGKTVLFLSGSGGSAEEYGKDVAYQYLKRGANFLLANYRGFGGSKQHVTDKKGRTKEKKIDPTQQGLYEDARAMFNWLGSNKGVAEGDIIVHGYSLGGAIAANLMAELAEAGIKPAGLVMHSAMPSTKEPAKDTTEEMLSFLPKKWARKIGKQAANWSGTDFTTDDKFQRLAAIHPDLPVLFISGDHASGDHLSDTHTGLSGRATGAGLNNVTNIDSTGSHFQNSKHISDKSTDFNTFLQSLTPQQITQVDQVVDDM